MPNGWTKVGTPEELKRLLDDPHAFRAKADELVDRAGAILGHIYFEKDGGPAFILTHVPSHNADETFENLDKEIGPTTRLYGVEELDRRRTAE
jgi:hypothetical protein